MKRLKMIRSVFLVLLVCGCVSGTHRAIRNPEVDHWDGQRMRYKNLYAPKFGYMSKTAYDDIDFRLPHERKTRTYRLVHNPEGDIDRSVGYDAADFTVEPDMERLRHPTQDVQITWLLHASFLIQFGDRFQVLVDPVLEEIDGSAGRLMKYADTFKLHARSPLTVEELPGFGQSLDTGGETIRIVAISHDHFDHLNWNTIEKLPKDTHYYVPLELERQFPSTYPHVTAMDWFTSDTVGELKISFLPANHRSGRTLNRKNDSLWGGWLFEWKGHRVYFAGDSGYSDLFKELGRRYGPVDVCLMPISAWFQRHYHFAPEDAIEAARDIGCQTFIPWGWGHWIMSYEHLLTPIRRLKHAWQEEQPESMSLEILKMGQIYSHQ